MLWRRERVTRPIVVLGGYGRIGRACVQELSPARAPIRRRLERARAESPRLFSRSARARVIPTPPIRACSRARRGRGGRRRLLGRDLGAALQCAVELRIPFVGLLPIPLGARGFAHVGELA
jgi:hypothetical protein